jgi:rhodanese-related sulfurtransferase
VSLFSERDVAIMLNRLFSNLFPAASGDNDKISVVDAAIVRQWYEAGEVVLIDVREAQEYAAEHIPGASHVPLSTFDPARVPVPSGKKLVIHCRSGVRCGSAAARLLVAGYEGEITRMRGGILGWKAAGGPTQAG